MRLKDTVIISDLDGTLVPEGKPISEKNLAAIREYESLGGTFTIATGRSPQAAERFIDMLELRVPLIVNNGAVIYDPVARKSLWYAPLDPSFREILHVISETYPDVGLEMVSAEDQYFLIAESSRFKNLVTVKEVAPVHEVIDSLPASCCKALFMLDPDKFDEIAGVIQKMAGDRFSCVKSSPDCYEMMASGIHKGYPLQRLMEILGKKIENSFAFGDYYNDIGMFTSAKTAVTLRNAPPEIQAMADLIVAPCEEDGAAELIAYLIQNTDH